MKSISSLFGLLLISSLFTQASEQTQQKQEPKKVIPKIKLPLPIPVKQFGLQKELHPEKNNIDSTSTHTEQEKPLFHFGSSTMMFAYHCTGNKHSYAQHLQSNK